MILRVALILLSVLLSLRSPAPPPPGPPDPGPAVTWLHDYTEARDTATQARRPLLLYIYGDSCPWCRRLEGQFYSVPELRAYTCVKLPGGHYVAQALGVTSVPVLVTASHDGTITGRQDGYIPGAEIRKFLTRPPQN